METHWVYVIVAMVVSYLCGSIPTSVWWGKLFYGIDVREHGSKNAGATNTFRVLGAKAGVPVLLIDMLKGFVPVRVLAWWSGLSYDSADFTWLRVGMALFAVLGHLYPVFAGFRGGKGVATSFGCILALHRGIALICLGVFVVVYILSRYVSLSSLCAALTFPVATFLLSTEEHNVFRGFSLVICVLVFWTHRTNIGRLLRGEEQRIRPSHGISP